MRRIALAFPLALLLSAACGVTAPTALAPDVRASPAPTSFGLPTPVPQPITRTSPGAQVAWLWLTDRDSNTHRILAGVNPSGAIVAQLDLEALGVRGVARSADGSTLYAFTGDRIDAYSALDGKLTGTYRGPATGPIDSAFSSNGRWAALLVSGPQLQLIDLTNGTAQLLPLAHDPKANLPGMGGSGLASVVWATLAFAPDSAHLYVLMDWGGPARLLPFTLGGSTWTPAATAASGSARDFPECAGPAVAMRVVQQGRMLAAFCHFDGAVWLFDLATFAPATVLHPSQKNPFWLSPVFTPDGQLLYLHQSPGFGDEMQVVDLAGRRVLGPVPTPTKTGTPGPFAWLVSVAYAGGVAATVPISPDGLRIYSATSAGIVVLRVPDLAPLRTLAPGIGAGEVWVSGDGRTVYAIDGSRFVIASDDGRDVKRIDLPKPNAFFIASEHG